MNVELEEGQRQAMLLAIAKLSIERPGWTYMLGEISDALHGRPMFDEFRRIHTPFVDIAIENGALEQFKEMDPDELIAQQIVQSGAIHALEFLTREGVTADNCAKMLASAKHSLATIQSIASAKGVEFAIERKIG